MGRMESPSPKTLRLTLWAIATILKVSRAALLALVSLIFLTSWDIDGVETNNDITFNLAAHIHKIGPVPWGFGQTTQKFLQSNTLTQPADVTASGFYISNVRNNLIGNAASGVSALMNATYFCCTWSLTSQAVCFSKGMVWVCFPKLASSDW